MPDKASRHAGHLVGGFVAALLVALVAPPSSADGSKPDAGSRAALRELSRPPTGYVHLLGSAMLGEGIRFNNPYRLRTELGDGGESLSLTSAYVDLGAGVAFGAPDGVQNGAVLRFSAALSGVDQTTLTPSYLLTYRGPRPILLSGRVGVPILMTPDANVGGELALGLAYFVTAGLGLCTELVGDLFYGASTREARYTVYPILSTQFGVTIDYEVLP
jgi:hypothetical protein